MFQSCIPERIKDFWSLEKVNPCSVFIKYQFQNTSNIYSVELPCKKLFMSRCEREAENVQFKSGLNFYQIWSFRRLIYMKCGKNICDVNIWNKFMRNGHQSIKPLLGKVEGDKSWQTTSPKTLKPNGCHLRKSIFDQCFLCFCWDCECKAVVGA